ncbi:transmembrane protein 256 [Gymnodraco acuticeps]|uniref:Transmembrane protein 256 n=1 Tax=Gymnodraco acuticeps TaxID=8218 RepID=A0A6P8UGZ6_GYMAC|nr:transmembrane protein 256 [Gymnodraco acuticeps]
MTAAVVVRRLAALSGASAVAAGAYGAHGFKTATPMTTRECYLKRPTSIISTTAWLCWVLPTPANLLWRGPSCSGHGHVLWLSVPPVHDRETLLYARLLPWGGVAYDRWLAGYNYLNCNSSRPLHRAAL